MKLESIILFVIVACLARSTMARRASVVSPGEDKCKTKAYNDCQRYLDTGSMKYFECWENTYTSCFEPYLKNRVDGSSCYPDEKIEEVCLAEYNCVYVSYPVLICL